MPFRSSPTRPSPPKRVPASAQPSQALRPSRDCEKLVNIAATDTRFSTPPKLPQERDPRALPPPWRTRFQPHPLAWPSVKPPSRLPQQKQRRDLGQAVRLAIPRCRKCIPAATAPQGPPLLLRLATPGATHLIAPSARFTGCIHRRHRAVVATASPVSPMQEANEPCDPSTLPASGPQPLPLHQPAARARFSFGCLCQVFCGKLLCPAA